MVLSKFVGASVRRKEDPRLITGSSTYVDDVDLPGTLHLAIVRSPYAHAKILSIVASAAQELDGVVAVYTGRDLATLVTNVVLAKGEGEGEPETAGTADVDEEAIPEPPVSPLAVDRVRYVGEGVAAVVATSSYLAEDAAALVAVEFEPLPVVVNPYEAMKEGAPRLYDEVKRNISVRESAVVGDVEAAFKDAPVVVKQRLRAPRVAPAPIEPRGTLAAPDPMTRGLTVWTSTQAPHWIRKDLAKALGIPETMVRVIAPEVGGGFGQKIGCYPEDYVVAAVAHDLKRPVKWIESRSENILVSNHGRNQWADIELAAEQDGTLRGLRAQVVLDSGAYPKALDLAWATMIMCTGCYEIPAVDYRVVGVYTNTMANGAYRGAGRPEAAYYVERAMDLLADATGLDPVEVRRKNFIRPDKFPYNTPSGERYDTGEYDKALAKAIEVVGYQDLRTKQAALRQQGRYLGIGLSTYVEICGFGPWESATARVEPNGSVSIFTGTSPHGQGTETTFAQLTADTIGAGFDDIVVHHGDTGNTPQGNGTMGSRSLAVGGAALMLSLNKIKEKATRIAAHMLEAAPADVELVDGKYRVRGVPDRGLTLPEIAALAYDADLPAEFEAGLESTDYFRPADETFPFGTHVAVVEVFPETGQVELQRYVSVDDCGAIVSPLLVTGQVHGGLAQGIGQALVEELTYDEGGELLTGTFNDYAMPKARLFPTFETHHTETTTPLNPLGAKGIGEAATIGATPATANAVVDALSAFGIRHLDIPFTPEKVWQAIDAARGGSAQEAD